MLNNCRVLRAICLGGQSRRVIAAVSVPSLTRLTSPFTSVKHFSISKDDSNSSSSVNSSIPKLETKASTLDESPTSSSSSSSSSPLVNESQRSGDVALDAAGKAKATSSHPLMAYAELSKARLSSLVVLTSGAGFLLAGSPVDWPACLAAVTGTTLAAAAANTFNQIYERKTDALMKRTMRRPLPSGRLTTSQAAVFGVGCAAASSAILLTCSSGPLAASIAVGNIILYACIYTPMKQVSIYNTHVGAVVGALPPLIGWAAATGSVAAVEPFLLSYSLFAWQFPHFYSLAWTLRKDYARGGHMMVPVIDTTNGIWTAQQSFRHALLLSMVPFVAVLTGVTSPMFAVEGIVLNGYFLYLARRFSLDPSDLTARPLFLASLWYLPVLLFLIVFHATSWRLNTISPEVVGNNDAEMIESNSEDGHVSISKRPFGQRGSSWGEAIEHALSSYRSAGRSICAHVLFVDAIAGRGAADRLKVFFDDWEASAALKKNGKAMCPVTAGKNAINSIANVGTTSLSSTTSASKVVD